ncbi:UDP-N-acetylmuramoyl-tripeptide-D-alanyl-D-alanine ligase [Oleispira antarctica RB-8]|uniref:UDP-N-acetylmuramoyl-tripeptide--D-alanyl-D-alanine ligase n=1 Tax=Oleispira antarctica RB-8 TaxID=698738 RepID=R4YQ21_OLEAN|nr:UDP-N-acetylmuramoyl-tripeptide-D-alanyl-D-alanine ligase [Oleispira antarctica RB-8]
MMMSSFSLKELAQVISAIIKPLAIIENSDQQADEIQALRINTDTRTIQQGDIFLALRGDHFDGHDYLEQAQKSGAVAAIVDAQYVAGKDSLPLLVVANTLQALGQASLWNRQKFTGSLIAITGSAGKTSVKSMASHMMTLLGDCWATPGNFNNHIGAPLTLLGIEPQHKAAVIELGASAEGEIAYTAQFAQPDVVIITNVSSAHLEGFGSIETIMRTKGEIIDSLAESGCAVLNADDVFYADWVVRAGQRQVISFGIENYADVMAKNIICDTRGSRFDVVYQSQNVKPQAVACEIPLLGQHNVLNALSAIAAGLALGLELEKIAAQFKTLPMVDGRLQWVDGEGQIRILNDSYNASPASVKAAIDVLALWKEKAWLVLGDMAELGDDSAAIHAEIGEYAQQKGIAHFVATGTACRDAVEAFTQTLANEEVANRSAHWFKQQCELLNYINEHKQPGQVFLVKGSRSAGMDKVVTALSSKKNQVIKSDSNSLNIIGEV